ncbi:VOC family protein [Paenibacillus sp. HJGM_3]|uniref:VOC family protein n=1 Tax=Paenibacillus sp. HJGM_3 TaxID=3379816 RepID=UPI00385814F8
MATTARQIYVNLPVKDLNRSVQFFSKVGFEFHPRFTDQNAACMIIGENIFAMLLTEDFFKPFSKKAIADASQTTEVIMAISADSREAVDTLVERALAAGGYVSNDKTDHGFMYSWSFQDIDHHLWEVLYMDESAIDQVQ